MSPIVTDSKVFPPSNCECIITVAGQLKTSEMYVVMLFDASLLSKLKEHRSPNFVIKSHAESQTERDYKHTRVCKQTAAIKFLYRINFRVGTGSEKETMYPEKRITCHKHMKRYIGKAANEYSSKKRTICSSVLFTMNKFHKLDFADKFVSNHYNNLALDLINQNVQCVLTSCRKISRLELELYFSKFYVRSMVRKVNYETNCFRSLQAVTLRPSSTLQLEWYFDSPVNHVPALSPIFPGLKLSKPSPYKVHRLPSSSTVVPFAN
ncbi:hypothetical protein STEG23_037438 [Scotinomys teguina]